MVRGYRLSINGSDLPQGVDVSIEPPETFYQSQARRLIYWPTLKPEDLEARDHDWIARELGDVEPEPVGVRFQRNGYIPVESLGRDE